MDMKFFIQETGKEFCKVYDRTRILVGTLHLAAGLFIFWLAGWIGPKTDSPALKTVLLIAGTIALLFFFYRALYLLFHMTIKGTKDSKQNLKNACLAFREQRVPALGLPALGFGLIVVEGLLLLLLREIPAPAGTFLYMLVLLPLTAINLVILWFVFIAGKLCYPLLIEKKTGIRDLIAALVTIVRNNTLPLIVYTLFAGLLYLVVYLALSLGALFARLVPVVIAGDSFSLLPLLSRGGISFVSIFDPSQPLQLLSSGDALFVAGGALLFIVTTLIVAFLLSFLLNIIVGTSRAMYETVKKH